MTPYTAFNLALTVFILPISFILVGPRNRRRPLLLSARVALLVTLIGYPWDFFAIQLGVWRYPNDAGLRIYDVPLNDLIFIWLCTYLTCSFLIAARRWQAGSQGHPERKNTD
jgi:lycopene cyclase domain-containing protein